MRPVCHQAIEPANYARLIDANIDFAHAIAIHKKSFGQRFHWIKLLDIKSRKTTGVQLLHLIMIL